jgi:lantibiotic modifying enzyme
MIFFLREYAARLANSDALAAAEKGARWLRALARSSAPDAALLWSTREGGDDVWEWWCHGSPGIALAWLKLYEHDPTPESKAIVRRALAIHSEEVRRSNLSVCHGLAGLGEIYVEAARVLGEPEWNHRALSIAETLADLASRTPRGARWMVEDGAMPTADLMVGCSGIAHFLLRVSHGDSLSFPLLP